MNKFLFINSLCLSAILFGASAEAAISWSEPEVLSQTADRGNPSVVINDQNMAAAIWVDSKADKRAVVSSFYSNCWQPFINISSYGTHSLQDPCIAMNSQFGMAMWNKGNTEKSEIRIANISQSVWFDFSTLYRAPDDARIMANLQLALSESGEGVAFWTRRYPDTLMTAFCSKGKWATPEAMPSEFPEEPGDLRMENAKVAISSQGDTVLVWDVFDGSKTIIKAAIKERDSATWGEPKTVSSSQNACIMPHASINHHGEAIVVWLSREEENRYCVQTASYAGGSWSPPSVLPDQTGNGFFPTVTLNNHGNALVTWHSDHLLCVARKFEGSWTAPTVISQPGWLSINHKAVLNDSENAVVVYHALQITNDPSLPSHDGFAVGFSGGEWEAPKLLFSSPESMPDVSLNNLNRACVIGKVGNSIQTRFGNF